MPKINVIAGSPRQAHHWAQYQQTTIRREDVRCVEYQEDLSGQQRPIVFLVGTYRQRHDWDELSAFLVAREAFVIVSWQE